MRAVAGPWTALLACLLGLGAGLVLLALGASTAADVMLLGATVVGLVLSTVSLWRAARERRASVDVLALLALVGALVVGELIAAAVVALMLATGQLLEARAQARAARELTLLTDRAPRTARVVRDGRLSVVPCEQVAVGDVVTVGPGEVTPVDGRLLGPGVFDESALTGEPLPVERATDERVRSGVVNAGGPVELMATTTSAESTYAEVVRLVEQAGAASAPFVRVADRVAAYFVPLALAVAGLAWWVSGDPVRAVAVLVIATPCPLLLAAPIAVMAGLSRVATAGVVVKGGAALESLGSGRVLLLDKTGTLTSGRPTVTSVTADPAHDTDEVLRLAASLDQLSPHVVAAAVVAAARRRDVELVRPSDVREVPGYGIEGRIDGSLVRVGKESWVVPESAPVWVRQVRRHASLDGSTTVYVGVDGTAVGALVLEDPIRPDATRMIRRMRLAGIDRVVLVSGDRSDIAETVGRLVGVDTVYAEQDPASKVHVVEEESAFGPTIMAGDGVNDAPSMAAASVGVALASRGSSAASQTADVVLTVDRIDALGDAILIARRSRRIALAAAVVGMSLALVGMLAAAVGLLAPTAGAVVQEGIDVLAIAIALTGLLPSRVHTVELPERDAEVAGELHREHLAVRALVDELGTTADALHEDACDLVAVGALAKRLDDELVPHERREEQLLLPVVARALGGPDPTGALSRTHAEIEHQVTRLRRLLAEIGPGPATVDDVVELRRALYTLHAVLRLHNAQEEESAFSLLKDDR
ncbi:MAG: heavy metal translocating P-type ATPase [Frankiales bacterium]|nr:heavy metal translocating P-type ATPase [Frankiales bacterium]